MSSNEQLLRLHAQGDSIKAIVRTLKLSKNTVKSYLHKLQVPSMDSDEPLKLEDPVRVTKFHSENPAYIPPPSSCRQQIMHEESP